MSEGSDENAQSSTEHLTIQGALAFGWKCWTRYPFACTAALFISVSIPFVSEVFGAFFYGRLTGAIAQQTEGARDLKLVIPPFLLLVFSWVYYWYGLHVRNFIRNGIDQRNLRQFFCDVSAHVQNLDIEWHNSTLPGSTVRAVNRGMWGLDDLGNLVFNNFVPTITVMVGSLAMLFVTQPLFGWIMAGFTLPYVAISLVSSVFYVAPQQRDAVGKESQGTGALADALGGNATVKAFAAEKRESARLDKSMGMWATSIRKAWDRDNWIGVLQVTVMITFRIAFVSAALWQWQHGSLSVGNFAFLMSLQYDVFSYLRDVGMHVRNLQKSVSDMDEAVMLLRLPPELPDISEARPISVTKGAIEFRNVSFGYQGQAKALYENLSLRLEPGQSVALVGRSGSGKSTFIKLLQRFYNVDSGSILVDGQDIRRITRASLRRSIALVPQDPALFHRSIADNIAYARPEASTTEIEEAARLAHASDFIARLPQGYKTVVGERGVKLSGGERQRIAIARVILANSPTLILDEATSSLDTESEQHIQQAFTWLMKNRTTIIIAHRLSTIRQADRVLIFDHGRVVEDGNHDSLLAKHDGIYRRMYQMQSGGFLDEQPAER